MAHPLSSRVPVGGGHTAAPSPALPAAALRSTTGTIAGRVVVGSGVPTSGAAPTSGPTGRDALISEAFVKAVPGTQGTPAALTPARVAVGHHASVGKSAPPPATVHQTTMSSAHVGVGSRAPTVK